MCVQQTCRHDQVLCAPAQTSAINLNPVPKHCDWKYDSLSATAQTNVQTCFKDTYNQLLAFKQFENTLNSNVYPVLVRIHSAHMHNACTCTDARMFSQLCAAVLLIACAPGSAGQLPLHGPHVC